MSIMCALLSCINPRVYFACLFPYILIIDFLGVNFFVCFRQHCVVTETINIMLLWFVLLIWLGLSLKKRVMTVMLSEQEK